MSLLIKALASAEKDKQAEFAKSDTTKATSFAELDLEPLPFAQSAAHEKTPLNPAVEAPANKADAFNTAAAASVAKVKQQAESYKDHERQTAANVFVANQAVKQPTSISTLLMLGAAGALMIWLGLQGYQHFISTSAQQHIVKQPVPTAAIPETVALSSQAAMAETGHPETAATEASTTSLHNNEPVSNPAADNSAGLSTPSVFTGKKTDVKNPEIKTREIKYQESISAELAQAKNSRTVESKPGDMPQASSLKLLSKTPAAGVDPTLQAAYEAYSRGDDAAAQTQYRQVLQADARNVDALLGMAAIALRQSRYADANGWYQKVLEIEPRNSTALSAVANLQISSQSAGAAAADYATTESQIKTMLAQQPESANLHAALGNLYAAQNQWSQAQSAYFNASRYAPNSAEYAFNLAVSLDQLGKSGLALLQYQRALSLLNNAGHGNLDKAQLEARIRALQQ